MIADVRKGIGCVYIVIKAETPEERIALDQAAERRDWSIVAKTRLPIGGNLQMDEIHLRPSEVKP